MKLTVKLPPVYLGVMDALVEVHGVRSRAALFRDDAACRPGAVPAGWLEEAVANAACGRPPWPGAVTEKCTFEVPNGSPLASLKGLPPPLRAESAARLIEAMAAPFCTHLRELTERFGLRWGALHVDAAWLLEDPRGPRRDVRVLGALRVDHDVSPDLAAKRMGGVVVYGAHRVPRPVYEAMLGDDGVVVTRLGIGRCNGTGLAEDGSWRPLPKRQRRFVRAS